MRACDTHRLFFSAIFSLTVRTVDIARLLLLAALWGGSYAFMRVVAPVFGGFGTMWLRISIAGVALLGFALLTREDLQFRLWWKKYLFLGLLNSALPFGLIAFAMKTLPAGYAAILNAIAPFFAALFAARMLDERLTPPRMLGMLLGFIGVVLVMNLGDLALTRETLTAVAAMVIATCSYGYIIVYTKQKMQGAPGMGLAVGSMLLPAMLLAPIGVMTIPPIFPPMPVVLSLMGLAIFCSAIAYLLYFRLIRDIGPTRAISVTFLVPVFGVLWGAIFFGEALNGGTIFGGTIVLVGVALVFGMLPIKFSRNT